MNKPLVSVIVPTYNSANYLKACLKSIINQSYERVELIVVDNNSQDNTKEIAKMYTSNVYNQGPERSAQKNFGVNQSQGDYILIIDSDMELTNNIVSSCIESILEDATIKALIIPEESFGEGFWSHCKKLERSFYNGVDWQESARFYDKGVYQELGGYDEEMIGAEDFVLSSRVKKKYGQKSTGRINNIIYHNEQNLSLSKACSKKFYYGKTSYFDLKPDIIETHFYKRTSIFNRYALYISQPMKLFKNPVIGLGMLFMKTCEFGAGAIGYLLAKINKLHFPLPYMMDSNNK
ncbi:MAG: glycosyltransferase [Nostoc sp.]|uniref:glycosyltransferase family 2 protein n=1 Tax=Nostoc sp. TaxID=1180 RepID=UPI002FFB0B6F